MSDDQFFSLKNEVLELQNKVFKLEKQLGSCDIVQLEKNIENVSIAFNQAFAWKEITDRKKEINEHDIKFIDNGPHARGLFMEVDKIGDYQKIVKNLLDNQDIKKNLVKYIIQLKGIYKDDDINDGIIEDLENIVRGKI